MGKGKRMTKRSNPLAKLWRGLLLGGALLLPLKAGAEAAPQAGAPAPEFALPDANGNIRQLADWRGQWLVLYFFPRDNTPGCTAEAAGFRDAMPAFTALKAQVVGVSLDDGASHRAFAEQHRLPFPLLVDTGGAVASRYGALLNLGIIKVAKRHTYLIDPAGRVAKAYLRVEPNSHAQEVLRDIDSMK